MSAVMNEHFGACPDVNSRPLEADFITDPDPARARGEVSSCGRKGLFLPPCPKDSF